MPNYIGEQISDAVESAQERTFQIIVNDSVHIVGKPGGLIQNQNPKPGALVKENRKIYVTTTKYRADRVDLSDMQIYGRSYEMVKAALERKGLRTGIKGYRYDQAPNVVLELWTKDDLLVSRGKNPDKLELEKGARVEFVVSSPEGGSELVQNVVGRSVNTARFIHQQLTISIENEAEITGDIEKAVIVSQSPRADGLKSLPHGSSISVRVREEG